MSTDAPNAVLVVGSANVDLVLRVAQIPLAGQTVLARGPDIYVGGKGANQAVACARAGGARTRMLLALGDDANARLVEASLRDAGVRAEVVRVPGKSTGMAFVCVADDAQNVITVAPGANSDLDASSSSMLGGVSHILMQLETPLPTVAAHARAAHAAGVTVILNAAPACPLPADLLASVDILIVNEDELKAVTRRTDTIADALAHLDVPCAVVTLGARGCLTRCNDQMLLQPSCPVEAVDTTAAGDTFCGVLAAAMHQGDPLAAALHRASAAAALACTRSGAQSSIPSAKEVATFLEVRPEASLAPAARADLEMYCGLG